MPTSATAWRSSTKPRPSASDGRTDERPGAAGCPTSRAATWAEFYGTQRLAPLARLAHDAGRALPDSSITQLERLAAPDRLSAFGAADEAPARLHGDLWAGNRMVDADGRSWLIDPAAHGGHREFDLAMMRLFGGFGPDCFAAYEEVRPLAPGWEERVALHQIAPLVVHAIKFGGSYVGPRRRPSSGTARCGLAWGRASSLTAGRRALRQRVEHTAAAHLDALGAEPPLLVARLVHGQRAVGPHHPPPRQPGAVLGQEATDGTGRSRTTGPAGHLPVGHDLTRREIRDDGLEAELQWRHELMVARPVGCAAPLPRG